jgi:hypothetical protein
VGNTDRGPLDNEEPEPTTTSSVDDESGLGPSDTADCVAYVPSDNTVGRVGLATCTNITYQKQQQSANYSQPKHQHSSQNHSHSAGAGASSAVGAAFAIGADRGSGPMHSLIQLSAECKLAASSQYWPKIHSATRATSEVSMSANRWYNFVNTLARNSGKPSTMSLQTRTGGKNTTQRTR